MEPVKKISSSSLYASLAVEKRMEKENERIRNIWHTIKYGLNVNNVSDEM